MGANSKISWTDHTFNPVWGCTKVGPGCDHCYAEAFDRRYGGDHWGTGKPRREFGDKHWNEPLRWNRAAEARGIPAKVFCASFADVFDNEWPDYVRPRLWALIKATPWLRWILVTKRIGNAAKMLPADWGKGYPNVWLLITVVTQEEADRDIPKLLDTPAAVRGLSIEPQIDFIDLSIAWHGESALDSECWGECGWCPKGFPPLHNCQNGLGDWERSRSGVDWVITGAESGPGARPYVEAWARELRDQCKAAEVAFFYKQRIDGGRKIETPELDGERWTQFPR